MNTHPRNRDYASSPLFDFPLLTGEAVVQPVIEPTPCGSCGQEISPGEDAYWHLPALTVIHLPRVCNGLR